MSASLNPQSKPAHTRNVARAQRRHMAAERKRQARLAAAAQREQRDEQLAPRSQRLPVLGRDGQIVRGARLERDGVSFRRSNPIRNMVSRGQGKDLPLLTKRHSDAADRLLAAWAEGGEGVTTGVSSYETKIGGTSSTGTIADSVLFGVNKQIAARVEIEAVKTRLGARWGCVFSIVIAGLDVSAWGAAVGFNSHVAAGFLAACLDTLVDHYASMEQHGSERRSRIRSIQIGPREGVSEAAD